MKVKVRPVRFLSVVAASLAIWLVMLTLNTAIVEAQGYDNRPSTENSLGLQIKSAILIDADTGQVLFQVNKDEPLPPASMTKLMTEYIVLKEIKDGRLKWDQIISVSPEAAETAREESQIFLAEGDQHTVRDLYIAMAVGSANDATRALATAIAGTEQAFVEKMNEMAKTLDLKSAVFTSATGYEPNTVISAADVAKLSYIILKEHPEFLDFSSMPEYKFRPRDEKPMINFNYMLGANKNSPGLGFLAYEGVDGMKTGFIEEAGYNFTGTVKRGDTRFISVVMDASTINVRFQETAKLYNYAFSTFEKKTVLPPKSVVETIQSVKIKKGAKKSVNVVTDKDITFMVKKGVEPKVELVSSQVKAEDELVAPIPAGTAVGTVTYKYTDAEQNIATEYTVNLVTTDEVKKAGWFKLMFRAIGDFFSGLFNGIIDMF
ncbi:D-alanyl-D-alanine carboxypeptidase family protein [Paenibacillus harenae]|uniref:D-alanyl-D-alanine carboxypeptidase family protein n=1 Tax=Paenibacillus harenae TaxID=306543 RepID=UPI0027909A47|nr:D-alanyl-D-alanine carboxypeptidase family protein [Paenibacillus harenae]MDQ0063920.1 D-alanyl-D-alanine carboxypeptidase (penicillin-binding protein 5/6) [Paenibacillus harenae]